ncbi:MmpL efflux pump [Thecamonas trahens ATCC 50062]|uniref:MmpL efflux pump n=1 Tax=Thecamonas trahens ATCC 50062 TaxID=461836 RepID=A0A0L0DMZ5_THETB|nr:MmpL efflux pump [Thecamonas trahens ATCC 50062]KNC53625.1 MmpL efflux pump [Thecamonas trahens ATCC 50062]|eukprot:XP_013761942.1 MmpL efflux pump [Thecamonas trahens ATCC 50062]
MARVARAYAAAVHKTRVGILVFWLLALGVSAWLGPRLITSTTNTFTPPAKSQAAHANKALAGHFPRLNPMDSSFVVYVYADSGSVSALDPAIAAFDAALASVVSAYTPDYCGTPCLQGYASYFGLLAQGLPPVMADELVGARNASTIITIDINVPFADSDAVLYAQFLQRKLTELRPAGPYGVVLIGLPAFMPLMQSSIERDMGLMDGIVMPLAMLVLAYILKSARLMVLPLAAIATSALVSFAIMTGVAQTLDIISFVPSLMMSILIAMNIDYELFLLTRYAEAIRAGHSSHDAVIVMLSTAGHTIVVSGLTLMVCFLGLVIFPLDLMVSTGVGCAVAIAITLLVNMSLTPALLLTFPSFFSRCIEPLSWRSAGRFWTSLCAASRSSSPPARGSDAVVVAPAGVRASLRTPTQGVSPASSTPSSPRRLATSGLAENKPLLATLKAFEASPKAVASPPIGARLVGPSARGAGRHPLRPGLIPVPSSGLAASSLSAVEAEEHHAFVNSTKVRRSLWYKIGHLTQSWPYNVIILILVVAATIPFDMHALNYSPSDAIDLDLPRGSIVTDAYLDMCGEFGYGKVYPYWILIEAPGNTSVLSTPFFKAAHDVVNTLSRLPNTQPSDFTGVAYANGEAIPYALLEICNDAAGEAYNSSDCRGLRTAQQTFVSSDAHAMLFEFTPLFDPISRFGHTWYKEARTSLNGLSAKHGLDFYLAGMPAGSWSAIESAYYWFPIMISITAGVVLVMVGVAFRSVLMPLRAVLTIGLTIICVYGMATLTYEYSLLEWTHIPGLHSFGSIEWLPPVVVFPIVVGITLDYDIFYTTRVQEYRSTGLATRDAAIKGLSRTGSIITAAGIIMAIAFSGLLLSNVAVINQLAFYLVFSVLFDTFVVRTFLVPSIMSFFGDWNWWPGRLAPITLAPLPRSLAGWNPCCPSCRRKPTASSVDDFGNDLLEPTSVGA